MVVTAHEERMRDGGFTMVSRRRGGGQSKRTEVPHVHSHAHPPKVDSLAAMRMWRDDIRPDPPAINEDNTLDSRLDAAMHELRQSSFVKNLLQTLRDLEGAPIDSLLCLGVGHFASNRQARYQFALVLVIIEDLLPSLKESEVVGFDSKSGTAPALTLRLQVYDPVLEDVEIRCVRRRGGNMREQNDEGRVQCGGARCLCYLPHCTRQLYSHLLRANWGMSGLLRLVVLGNSFAALASASSSTARERESDWCCITRVSPFVQELPCDVLLGDSTFFDHAFSSTNLHWFVAAAMPGIDALVWTTPFKPWPYTDIELLTPASERVEDTENGQ